MRGNMVGDREVVGLVLRELLRKEYEHGAHPRRISPHARFRSSV